MRNITMNVKHLLLAIAALAISLNATAQETKNEKFQAFADKYLKLSGYIQGGFEWTEAPASDTAEATFYLKRARVSLSGNAAEEKIDYRLQVDMAGKPKICDLYFRYKPLNQLGMQLGQFKVPFAIENELIGPTTFEFIEYSYITTYFARNNKTYDGIDGATGRDIGFQLYGSFIEKEGYNIINYNVAIFNGAGINTKDNNIAKDYVARLIVKPIKDLSISGSVMYADTMTENEDNMGSLRWSVGAWYNSSSWIARAEYAEATFGYNKAQSCYAMAGYNFEKPWSVVARYEFIKDIYETLNQERITLGGVYKPYKFLRLQLNASYITNFAAHAAKKNPLGINLMVSAIF